MAAERDEIQEEAPPKKSGKLKWIILLVLLLAFAGAGYFAYQKFFAHKTDAMPERGEHNATQKASEPGAKLDTQLVTLPTFQVNLSDPSGRRFLKLTMDVELPSKKAADLLQGNMSKVKDRLILLLSSKTYADLSSYESKLLLKDEIIDRLNQILGGPKIVQIYFTELVIM
jgi:flagellar protein FliL